MFSVLVIRLRSLRLLRVSGIVMRLRMFLLLITFLKASLFSSRRRHTSYWRDWSSDVCSSDLALPREVGEAVGPDAEHLRNNDKQIENARYDDDADGARGDGAARIPRLLTERGGRFKAGERGDAVDHRIGDVGELAVRRRCRCENGSRVMVWGDLDQDRDGKCRDDGHFPGHKDQIDRG